MELFQEDNLDNHKENEPQDLNSAPTVGDCLRELRSKKGIDLQKVAKDTRISLKYLNCLENNQFDSIISPTYAKGFLKSYASYLNADINYILQLYYEQTKQNDHLSHEKFYVEPEQSDFENPIINALKELDVRIVSSIIGGIFIFYLLLKGCVYWKEHNLIEEDIFKPMQTGSIINLPNEATPIQKIANQKTEFNLDLEVVAIKTVWLRVISDDRLVYEHTMKKGQAENFKGKTSISVKLGDASAIQFIYNGEKIDPLGAEGAVLNITFDQNGRWVSE